MLYRVVCLLALCASTQSLSLGPKYAARSHVARAGIARAGLETLTEEAALALEGDELEAVATELSVYLFKSPPFQEKAEQPKRRMLALVYDKLGIMGKAESCAREASKVDKKDLDMLLLLGKCEENRAEIAAAAAAGGGGKAEFYLAKQTYSKAIKLDSDGSGEAAKGLERASEGMARAAGDAPAAAAAPAKKENAAAATKGAVGVPEACKFMADPTLEGMSVEDKSAFLASKGVDAFIIAQATCVTNEDNVQGHPELPVVEEKPAAAASSSLQAAAPDGFEWGNTY